MKITANTKKEQLRKFLEENITAVKEKNLKDRVSYTLKAKDEELTRKDLLDLAKEVEKTLTQPEAPKPKAENSVKKLNKNAKKDKTAPEVSKSEKTAEKPEAPEKEQPKKSKLNKNSNKVASSKTSKKSIQMADIFPETLEYDTDEGHYKYELASDIKTMADLKKAYDNNEPIVFAFYWTKRHLKQFDYFGGKLVTPESFENDLDLASVMHMSEALAVCYQVSLYTEAVYAILPQYLEEEDGVRFADGVEFQIYRDVTAHEEPEEQAEA